MKKIMMLATVAILAVGCDKSPVAQNAKVKTEEVESKALIEKITEKEIEDLKALKESPSKETASLAGYYLSNLELTPVEEIREFIAKGWDEWET